MTLTVTSAGSISAFSGVAGKQQPPDARAARVANHSVTVDTRCKHGGLVSVTVDQGVNTGPGMSIMDVSWDGEALGQAHHAYSGKRPNRELRASAEDGPAARRSAAPAIITVMF